jgi:uncharacterized protein
MKRLSLVTLTLLLSAAASANSASFDCGKASTKIEKMICGDAELSRLDEDLGKSYRQALDERADKQGIMQEQKRWIKEVRNKCEGASCLNEAYISRISHLSSGVQNIGGDESTPVMRGGARPEQIPAKPGLVKSVSVGLYHVCALLNTGQVKCWGRNDKGQLGDGTMKDSLIPVAVKGIQHAVSLFADSSSACVIEADGQVKCWGVDGGDRPRANSYYGPNKWPDQDVIDGIRDAQSVVLDGKLACALIRDGHVRCWVSGGLVAEVSGVTDAVVLGYGCAIVRSGSVVCWEGTKHNYSLEPQSSNEPRLVAKHLRGADGAVALSYNCALLSSGSVNCWGSNEFGQLGDGTTISRDYAAPIVNLPKAVALVGDECAVLAEGGMACWGAEYGDAVTHASTAERIPHLVGARKIMVDGLVGYCGLMETGKVHCYNPHGGGETAIDGIDGAVSIDMGDDNGCVVLKDGRLKCWGRNNRYGQLGNGKAEIQYIVKPVVYEVQGLGTD